MFDKESLQRIKGSVEWTETARQGDGTGATAGRAVPQGFFFGRVKEPIARYDTGKVSILGSIKTPEGDEVREADVYCWGCGLEIDDLAILGFVTGTLTVIAAVRD
jgi:hypothetical protein